MSGRAATCDFRDIWAADNTPLSFWHCIYRRTRHQHPRGREQNPRLASAARVWVLPVARPGSARIAFFRSSEFGFRISARVIPVWPGVCFASNCDSLTFWGGFRRFCSRIFSPSENRKKDECHTNLGRRLPRECDRAGLIPGVSPVQRTSCSLR